MRHRRRGEAEAYADGVTQAGAGLRAADVLVVACHVGIARHLVEALRNADLRVDRAAGAEEVAYAIGEALPPPMVVIVVSDDELERLRVRRAMACSPSWGDVPVIDAGLGAIPVADIAVHLARHRRRMAGTSV